MAVVQIIADDGLKSNDNLYQPEISTASTTLLVERWRPRLIVLRHWLVFLFALIAFPIAWLLFSFSLNKFFSGNWFMKWIIFSFLLCGCFLYSFFIVKYLIFISEGNLIKKRVKPLYLLFHVENRLFYLICSILYLLSWILFMKPDIMGTNLFHNFIPAAMLLFVISNILWISNILILKNAYSNYCGKNFFEKMEHLIDQERVLKALLFGTTTKLYTICNALHTPFGESQANTLYGLVKKKFANKDARDMRKTDLQRFMNSTEVAEVLKFFAAAEFINLASLKSWMVKICEERKTLLVLINDTNTAIEDIYPIISWFKWALLFFAGCFFLGFATLKVLAVIAIPLLALFLGIYRNVPDGIIFVFKMHRFDIGDCCIVDDKKMVVKDIGIFTTDFYNENNEIVSFTNSVLTTKSITNLTRSPVMSETLEVCVSKKTLADDIAKLESGIDKFLESKPESWSPEHSLLLKEVGKKGPKYALRMTHSAKFETYELHNIQRSELLDELTKILKKLGIEYFTIQ